MSIEKDFGRIASALERIATVMEGKTSLPVVAVAPAPVPAPAPAPAPVAAAPTPPAPAAPVPVAAAPTPPAPSPAVAMTITQLNEILVAEFKRLNNNREPIDNILRDKFGVVGVSALPVEKYSELVDAVRAVTV